MQRRWRAAACPEWRGAATLVFHQQEDILTLGALVAAHIFETAIPVFSQTDRLSGTDPCRRHAPQGMQSSPTRCRFPLTPSADQLVLTDQDLQIRNGAEGRAMAMAMDIICRIAAVQGAHSLRDVTRGHIDGYILAHPTNLVFAEKMAALGARRPFRPQPTPFRLTSAAGSNRGSTRISDMLPARLQPYANGAAPTFTCALSLESPPAAGESIGWSESNAVIYANTVLGARSMKLRIFWICLGATGRAPLPGAIPMGAAGADRRCQPAFDKRMTTAMALVGDWLGLFLTDSLCMMSVRLPTAI